MTSDEKGTAMRVPPSSDGDTPSGRTPEPVRGGPWTSHGHPIAGLTIHGPGRPSVARCGGPRMCNKCATEQARLMEAARTETITDRAAIRASDEPSERGDFPYYDLGPATSETVGALGDALLGAVNTIKATGGAVEIAGVRIEPCDEFGSTLTTARAENAEHLLRLRSDALARVTREAEALRAKVAAVEALAEQWADRKRSDGLSGNAWIGLTLSGVAADLRAALATGEGK